MGKLSGKIVVFRTLDNEKQVGFVRHIDQLPEFQKKGKVLVRYIDDDSFEPILKDGREITRLISPDRLKIIGFVD